MTHGMSHGDAVEFASRYATRPAVGLLSVLDGAAMLFVDLIHSDCPMPGDEHFTGYPTTGRFAGAPCRKCGRDIVPPGDAAVLKALLREDHERAESIRWLRSKLSPPGAASRTWFRLPEVAALARGIVLVRVDLSKGDGENWE